MGAPSIPKPPPMRQEPDVVEAQIKALDYAATQRRIKASQGRAGSFLAGKGNNPAPSSTQWSSAVPGILNSGRVPGSTPKLGG